ncbi:MAG TPA: type II toxin-antitoxin system RelE/ParE family toxin [Clostridiales bacterium]|nr:type II toxin-antitoxin system RelE/ParE family toxin [Clostridiales bacterium]
MKYRLIIANRAEELLDHILYYIINQLKNPGAARRFMSEIEHVYDKLESSPEVYPYSEDTFLRSREYRKAVVPHYDYVIIFRIDKERKTVYIVGFFHDLELYKTNYS